MSTITPTFLWAQDKNQLFLTIQLSDVQNTEVKFTSTTFSFSGSTVENKRDAEGKEQKVEKKFALTFDFANEIDEEDCKYSQHRLLEFLIAKKEKGGDYWDHILKTPSAYKGKCKTDFAKWIDSDDEGDLANHAEGFQGMGGGGMGGGMGGMDLQSLMAGMGGGGGMPGMGGMGDMPDFSQLGNLGGDAGDEDSDDEPIPDLEDDGEEVAVPTD
jgi:hypothetical protein